MLIPIIVCIAAYSIGSISSAVIICRLMDLPDPRKSGSKNPGATNVLRSGNKSAAITTLIADILKGFIPVYIAIQMDLDPWVISCVMVAVFLGHLYPVFFNFQGGKGVATSLGAIFALSWPVGLLSFATFAMTLLLFRIVSLASLVAAVMVPIYMAWLQNAQLSIPVVVISILLFWRHRSNIVRLIHGEEPRLGKKI